MKPEISVIIPTYNRASVLPRAVESVLNQSFQNLELIVVDDGSSDSTANYLEQIADSRVKTLKTENRGVSAARNLAVKNANAPWVSFLDSDDEWLREKLSKQWRLKDQFSIIHGEEIWIRNGVRVNPMKKHKKSGGDVFKEAVKLCCISPSTVLLKKELLEAQGGFREDFPVCEDYDLWLKITCENQVGFVPDPIINKFGGHDDQLSRKFFAMDYWRVLSLHDVLNKDLSKVNTLLAATELQNKAQVLLKGYRKHGNLSHYDEIFSILKKAEKLLTSLH